MRACDLGCRRRRLTHIPLANTQAVSSFKNVEMDVVIVIAVSARSQHRSKAMTGRIPQRLTKRVLLNVFIGEFCTTVASEDQSTDIDGIALAMFAKFGIASHYYGRGTGTIRRSRYRVVRRPKRGDVG